MISNLFEILRANIMAVSEIILRMQKRDWDRKKY